MKALTTMKCLLLFVKPMSYKVIFAVAAGKDWESSSDGMSTLAFLYGSVEEDMYKNKPTGYGRYYITGM